MSRLAIHIYKPDGKVVENIATIWDGSDGALSFTDEKGDEYLTNLPYFGVKIDDE